MPINREGRTPGPESLETEKPFSRVETIEAQRTLTSAAAEYRMATRGYPDEISRLHEKIQGGLLEQIDAKMEADATRLRKSAERLSGHPEYGESARHMMEVINVIHPESETARTTKANDNFDNKVDELV